MKDNYTVYHCHTEQSLLDSCTNYKLYVDKAKELGQSAICFTEHGNLYNWVEKKMYCEEKGIKFLHGVECYLTETHEIKKRDNFHTILIAKNRQGFEEINKLVFSSTQKDHVYYKPRLSFDEFLSISDNVIKISACVASPINYYRQHANEVDKKLYNKVVKHYDYFEIQYHNAIWQIEYNQALYKLSKRYDIPLIAGTDTHSLNQYKAECRTILQWGKTDGDWGNDENECDLTYKSYDELIDMFTQQNSLPMNVVLEAINNTNIMADSCDEIILDKSIKYPLLYDNDEEVLWEVLRTKYKQKVKQKIIQKNQRYIDNIKEEMRVFNKTNMTGFMLFMSEMLSWCRENNIPTSPCRGSVGGSTVAYISDIIDVDPIKWNTVFSRFCNEDRVEVGDIDCDFYEDDRPKVYEYIINRFGKEKTAYILASGTIVDKGTIDLIGRALHNQWKRNNGIAKNDKSQDYRSPYSLTIVKNIKELYEQNEEQAKEQYKELFYYFEGLLNTVVSQSQHPAGIIASPINLIDNYSMFVGADGQYIIPINMEEVHEIGLVKYDILGLKNVGIIRKACEYANITYPLAHEINWEDENVFNDMTTSPIGIFQFEGKYAFDLLKRFSPHTINDMSLVNASLRPSGESYRDRLIAREFNHNPSELIDNLLAPNHGYLVFQEDVIAFLQQICGLSGSDADNVRRAIGRKQIDRLQEALPHILEGYCSKSPKSRDIAEEEAKTFLKIIEDASSYMFGFNHSTGYSMLGYLCAYMRYYYTKEFICAYLNCANNEQDIYDGTMLAKERNIQIECPKFRKSLSEFVCDKSEMIIYKGLSSIKDIGKNNGEELYALKDNIYSNFFELLQDIKSKTKVNSKQLDILIRINFFDEFGDINTLLTMVEIFNTYSSCKQIKKENLTPQEFKIVSKHSNKQSEKIFKEFNNMSIMQDILSIQSIPQTTLSDIISNQIKFLGHTSIMDSDNIYYAVTQIEFNNYGTPFITLYQISTGISQQYKADKKFYNQFPLEVGDIIESAFRDKTKRTKINDEWVDLPEQETVLSAWAKQNI